MQIDMKALIDQVDQSEISSTRVALTRILLVINNPHSSAFDLKNLIERDPPLTIRVLKRANSAFYGFKRAMVEILEAIVCIGFESVKELVLNQSVCDLFQNDEVVHGYSRASLWVHCVAVALCGKLIYRREYQLCGEQIYTAGLLHDIGIIIEDQFLRPQFLEILADFEKSPEKGLYACERSRLGFTHAEIGAALAQSWSFPEPLCRTIGTESIVTVWDEPDARMTATLCVARWACQCRKIGFIETPQADRRQVRDGLQRLNITERGLDFIMDTVEKQIGQMRDEGWF